jgi:hypothetical protein
MNQEKNKVNNNNYSMSVFIYAFIISFLFFLINKPVISAFGFLLYLYAYLFDKSLMSFLYKVTNQLSQLQTPTLLNTLFNTIFCLLIILVITIYITLCNQLITFIVKNFY